MYYIYEIFNDMIYNLYGEGYCPSFEKNWISLNQGFFVIENVAFYFV